MDGVESINRTHTSVTDFTGVPREGQCETVECSITAARITTLALYLFSHH